MRSFLIASGARRASARGGPVRRPLGSTDRIAMYRGRRRSRHVPQFLVKEYRRCALGQA
jgi:hypothetical protein